MARQAALMKKTRTRYSQDYKAEVLALADCIGISAASRELGLQSSQLYQWRTKAQQRQSVSEREQALADENARLKRQLAEKSEELEMQKSRGVLCQEPEDRCPRLLGKITRNRIDQWFPSKEAEPELGGGA